MDTNSSSTDATTNEETVPGKTDRPPSIILTSTTKLIQLQKQLQNVVKENFQFHSTRNGIRVIMKVMVDFQSVKSQFDTNNLSYYSFYLKSEKPMNAVIGHLPHNSPAEDMCDGLVRLGFDVISVKQMKPIRRSPPEGSKPETFPFY
jgi:hypothetical protein